MGCSGEQKVTAMVLKVDLQCCECYLKVKRLLCKFPQIRDQVFDEKHNTVTITVVCCNPERIRDKLCSKGRKSIKSIEIKDPKKPDSEKPKSKPEDKPKQAPADPAPAPAPAPAPVLVEPEKPKPKPKAAPEPQAPAPAPTPAPAPAQEKPPEKLQKNGSKSGSKNGSKNGSKKSEPAAAEPKPADNPPPKQAEAAAPKAAAPEPAEEASKPKAAEPEVQWVPGYPPGPPPQQTQAQAQMSLYPVAVCCTPCYDGVPPGGYQGGGYGPPPNNYGYAYGRPTYPPAYYPNTSRCDYNYFSEENPSACSIM